MKILEKKLFRLSLQFFADEGADGGSANGDGTAGVENEVDDDDLFLAEMEQKYGVKDGVASAQAVAGLAQRSVAHSEEAKTEGDNSDQVNDPEEEAEPNVEEKTAEEEFDELIKSDKFKSIYGQKLSSAITDRLKNQSDARAEADKYKGTLSLLAAKYGKNADDIDGITAAIEADDSLLEDEAFEKGKSVEALRLERKRESEKQASEIEVKNLKSEIERLKAHENARNDAERWMRESKETVSLYPDFNLKEELKNAEFLKYLRMDGMTVTEAFEHAHLHDIMASSLKAAERRADANAAKIAARNMNRVVENAGAFKANNSSPKIDVRNLSDADFEKIDEMIARGEAVTLDHLR